MQVCAWRARARCEGFDYAASTHFMRFDILSWRHRIEALRLDALIELDENWYLDCAGGWEDLISIDHDGFSGCQVFHFYAHYAFVALRDFNKPFTKFPEEQRHD